MDRDEVILNDEKVDVSELVEVDYACLFEVVPEGFRITELEAEAHT